MKDEEVSSLVRYRLDQAQTALEDAIYLLEGNRSPQSIINRAYYAIFYSALALLQKIGTVPSKHTGVVSLFDTELLRRAPFPRNFQSTFIRLLNCDKYRTTKLPSRFLMKRQKKP